MYVEGWILTPLIEEVWVLSGGMQWGGASKRNTFGRFFSNPLITSPRGQSLIQQRILIVTSKPWNAAMIRKEPEGKNAKGKNFWKLRGRKECSRKIFQKISQMEDITFTGFWSISGYLRNLRGRLLFFWEVFGSFYPPGFLPLSLIQMIP